MAVERRLNPAWETAFALLSAGMTFCGLAGLVRS
jgi:hypothetical protein